MDPVFKSGLDRTAGEAVVLRMRLKAFTLGHYFLLEELDSPFLNSLKPIELGDLLKAVLICSTTYAKARKAITGRMAFVVPFVLGLMNRSKRSFDLAVPKFIAYLDFNRELPAVRACPAGGRTRHAPEPWRLLVMLMQEFQMDLAEALDTPVRQANSLWAVQAELAGALELMPNDTLNDERLRLFREFAQMQDRRTARN